MPSAARVEVSSHTEVEQIAGSLLGTEGSIEVALSAAREEATLSPGAPDSVNALERVQTDVVLAEVEQFVSPGGGPDLLYGHLVHPYEGSRAFADIYRYFAEQCRWRRFVNRGDFVIDVGAHSGDTTLVLAELVGVTGSVLAFDPNPAVLPTLLANAMINDSYDIEVEGLAVAATSGTVVFTDHSNLMCNGGVLTGLEGVGNAVVDRIEALSPERLEVEAVNLVEYLMARKDRFAERRVSFIKTDCEGFDALIVGSLQPILTRDRPALFVEWFEWFNLDETEMLFSTIDSVGYQAYEPETLNLANRSRKVSDLLCLPKGTVL
ncbi:MAG TPA: hypothetical protein DCQ36_03415 [Actinobacteria bacterium]|nr:hypothetical protein [Actinomycetota bacterium]